MKRTILLSLAMFAACVVAGADEICGAQRVQARAEIIWTKPVCKVRVGTCDGAVDGQCSFPFAANALQSGFYRVEKRGGMLITFR